MKASNSIRPHQVTFLIAGFATLIGFLVPIVRQLLLPVMYLNTHLHELSHALVAKATGAEVEKIVVNADGSGLTPVLGGNIFLTASAGYIGASIFGAIMIAMGSSEKTARYILTAICLLLTTSMLVWVRGDSVGVASGFAWVLTLAAMAIFLKGRPLMFCCQFLGLQQCLNSFNALFALVRVSSATETHSDATILQGITGVPSIVWAVVWSAFSLGLVGWTLRRSWAPRPQKA